MARSRLPFVALVAALALVASACFGGGGGGATRAKHQNGSSGGNGPGCQYVTGSTLTREIPPRVDKAEYLVDATAVSTVCYDEITFVFQPGDAQNLPPSGAPSVYPPSYTVQYKQPPFAPGIKSSAEALPGVHAILEVTLQPASATDVRKPGSSTQTYRGNLRLQLTGLRHTLIVEVLDKFPQPSPDPNASEMVWLIGLDSKRPFTTQSAIEPPRVSVLIPH
jgi:hypothetical protein